MITKPKKKVSKRISKQNPRESHISGYPVLYLDKNDNVFCAECAKKSFTQHPYWEGSPVECEKCGEMIESAYGDPEESKKRNPTKKVAKRVTKKKVAKRKNPRMGEVFRQQHEHKIDLMRGPQFSDALGEDNSPEADEIRERIRKNWLLERGFRNSKELTAYKKKMGWIK